MRVWVDFTNTAHVLVLRPLVERLEADGHDVELTARPLSHTLELLDDWAGSTRRSVTTAARDSPARRERRPVRVPALLRWARGRGFGCAIAHGSTDQPPVARALRFPSDDDARLRVGLAPAPRELPAGARVLAPDAIPVERMARYGARGSKLARYPGLKEEYYLAEFEPDEGVLATLGVEGDGPLAVVRTAPSYALYLGGAENQLLCRASSAAWQRDGETTTVVLARTEEQRDAVGARPSRASSCLTRAVDGRSLVALADLLVSAGGTMNREAAVLGTPVWSIFEGRMGAVDEKLAAEGRLRFLADPADLEIRRKPDGAWRERVRRDPADLLRLALPWLAP